MLKIGEFANLFNISIKTVRFYEEKELIKPYFAAIGKRYPEKLQEIVITEIGEGRKLSDIPEEDLVPLENVFNKLVTFACDRNIIVD